MKRMTLLTIVVFCGAALAANVPRSVIHGQTEDERRSDVFSEFIALSDTRGSDVIPFLSDFADITGQTARSQRSRLEHVPPAVLDLLAEKSGLDPEDYRQALLDGRVLDPFDHSGSVIETPNFDVHGRDGAWFWGVWEQGTLTVQSEPFHLCRIWLVVWNDETWYYTPMGTDMLNDIALAAGNERLNVPFLRLPECHAET